MESVIVNARIPLAKKEAAASMLAAMGSSTSELINSAYDYLLRFERLPSVEHPSKPPEASFSDFVSESSLPVDWSLLPETEETENYKEILHAGRAADYESLT